jgi:hypothetical protein
MEIIKKYNGGIPKNDGPHIIVALSQVPEYFGNTYLKKYNG